MKKEFSNFGFSTLLIGFTMLCILTFSVLTLVTANSDYKLSKKYAEKNTSYYEAEAVAYSTLSSIDSQLYNIYRRSVSAEDYFNIITTELNIDSKHKGLKASENGNLYYDFDIEISKIQSLEISLQICYPASTTDNFYQIKKWQLVTDTAVDEDNTLNLLQ